MRSHRRCRPCSCVPIHASAARKQGRGNGRHEALRRLSRSPRLARRGGGPGGWSSRALRAAWGSEFVCDAVRYLPGRRRARRSKSPPSPAPRHARRLDDELAVLHLGHVEVGATDGTPTDLGNDCVVDRNDAGVAVTMSDWTQHDGASSPKLMASPGAAPRRMRLPTGPPPRRPSRLASTRRSGRRPDTRPRRPSRRATSRRSCGPTSDQRPEQIDEPLGMVDGFLQEGGIVGTERAHDGDLGLENRWVESVRSRRGAGVASCTPFGCVPDGLREKRSGPLPRRHG